MGNFAKCMVDFEKCPKGYQANWTFVRRLPPKEKPDPEFDKIFQETGFESDLKLSGKVQEHF